MKRTVREHSPLFLYTHSKTKKCVFFAGSKPLNFRAFFIFEFY
uniref:Uncharacterized protein n=1 Tax=Myoviridae sp. ct0f722 TaxID=2827599 RepID=A0A8S5LPL0_9CAUD|nr:MAG TPA: hypothetical protein [Myoviridae sp. ct0f722]